MSGHDFSGGNMVSLKVAVVGQRMCFLVGIAGKGSGWEVSFTFFSC